MKGGLIRRLLDYFGRSILSGQVVLARLFSVFQDRDFSFLLSVEREMPSAFAARV